jgi:hypothetical protein
MTLSTPRRRPFADAVAIRIFPFRLFGARRRAPFFFRAGRSRRAVSRGDAFSRRSFNDRGDRDMNRLPSLSLFVLGLSACAAATPDSSLLVDATPTGATTAVSTAQGAAASSGASAILALPPRSRLRGELEERRFADGWRQIVTLDRAPVANGWNELTVDLRSGPPGVREAAIPMARPSEPELRREMALRFPTRRMRIVARPLKNALGPFGLAVGRGSGRMRCAYAWQWVDDLRAVSTPGEAAGSSIARGDEIPASIRLRLCRRGLSEARLVDWFSHLRLAEAGEVDRVVAAARSGSPAGTPPTAFREPAPAPGILASAAAPEPAAAPGGGVAQPSP